MAEQSTVPVIEMTIEDTSPIGPIEMTVDEPSPIGPIEMDVSGTTQFAGDLALLKYWMGVYSRNLSAIEAAVDDIGEESGDTAATAAEAKALVEEIEESWTELEDTIDSIGITRESRLNRPNLLKQNYAHSTTIAKAREGWLAAYPAIPPGSYSAGTWTYPSNDIDERCYLAGIAYENTSELDPDELSVTFSEGMATVAHPAFTITSSLNITVHYKHPIEDSVICDLHTVAAEDATAAAEPITYTITDERITAACTVLKKTSSNYDAISTSLVSVVCSAGSATVTIAARDGANDGATIKLWICETVTALLPYGENAYAYGTGAPWMNSTSNPEYPGGDVNDGISESVVTLAAADQITDGDGEVYTQAIQYNVSANTAWGNADWLIYKFGSYGETPYRQGGTPYRNYADIPEMQVGEAYTVSCWARMISGDAAWVCFAWGGKYGNTPQTTYTNMMGKKSDPIEVTGGEWQRISWTFVFEPIGEQYTETTENVTDPTTQETYVQVNRVCNWVRRVQIGVCRKYTGVLQLCGFRLTAGGLYLPTAMSQLEERVAALEERILTLEGIVTENGGE